MRRRFLFRALTHSRQYNICISERFAFGRCLGIKIKSLEADLRNFWESTFRGARLCLVISRNEHRLRFERVSEVALEKS